MKKIILDCDLMKYRNSGLYYYCLNLGNAVKKILDKEQKEKMIFYVPEQERNTFKSKANCIIEKKWHTKYIKPFLWNCDIWHAPFQSGRPIQKYNKRMKVVLTIHDLNVLHEDKSEKERMESLQRTQKLIDSSDALVCISNHCKKDVVTHLDTGLKPVYVIHNGTHHIQHPPPDPEGYKPDRPFIFTMGYVNRKKNFHTLLALLKQPGIELVVAGKLDEPDYIERMRQQAREMGVNGRLRILGPVSEADKSWYYQHAEAFILPSLAEGFGAPVVEAMKFGKPIFLSDRTSLPEVGGDVSFYFRNFEPDHMIHVYNEGIREFKKNGLAGRIMKRADEFKWEEKAKEYVNVYRSLI
jgi:glycosyltransferase involved in cell wall biosynthesis